MAPSEAQKRAAAKWTKENMSTLACKVRKEDAEAFKEYATTQGKTSNTVLKECVMECIDIGEGSPDKVIPMCIDKAVEYLGIAGNCLSDLLSQEGLTLDDKHEISKKYLKFYRPIDENPLIKAHQSVSSEIMAYMRGLDKDSPE